MTLSNIKIFLAAIALFYTSHTLASLVVSKTKGINYIFLGENSSPIRVQLGQKISSGSLIATSKNSHLVLSDSSPHYLVLGEESKILIREKSKIGNQLISLISGRVHHSAIKGKKLSPSNKLITIQDNSKAFHGDSYTIQLTEDTRAITVHDGKLSSIKLRSRTEGLDELDGSVTVLDSDDSIDDEEESLEEDDLSDDLQELTEDSTTAAYLAQLKKQNTFKRRPLRIKKKKKKNSNLDFKFIARAVKYQQTQSAEFEFLGIQINDSDIPESLKERFNGGDIEQYTYDLRLEWLYSKEQGDGKLYTSGWIEYGSDDELYREPFQILNNRKPERNILEINELYLLNSWNEIDFTFGKKIFKIGHSFLYSPTDRITPKDSYDPLDTKDLGNWLIQLDKYKWGHTFTYLLIPYFAPNRGTQSSGIKEAAGEIETIYPGLEPKSFSNLVLIKGTNTGYDYYTGLFYGPSLYPVNSEEIDSRKTLEEFPKVTNLIAGFSKNLLSINIYSDFLYQRPEAKKDDEYLSYTVGMKYKNTALARLIYFNHFDFIIEYSKEKIQNSLETIKREDLDPNISGKFYLNSSKDYRPNTNSLLGRLVMNWSETLDFTYNISKSLDSGKLLQIYGLEYSPIDNLFIRLHFESFRFDVDRNALKATQEFERFTLKTTYDF